MTFDLNMPILVVEDDGTMAGIIRAHLERLGFKQIYEAYDGATALALIREKQCGLVISDWNMKPMDGQMLLGVIRSDPALRHIPFIMVTSYSRRAKVMAALESGVDDYIVKPFVRVTLQRKIETVLERARHLTALAS